MRILMVFLIMLFANPGFAEEQALAQAGEFNDENQSLAGQAFIRFL